MDVLWCPHIVSQRLLFFHAVYPVYAHIHTHDNAFSPDETHCKQTVYMHTHVYLRHFSAFVHAWTKCRCACSISVMLECAYPRMVSLCWLTSSHCPLFLLGFRSKATRMQCIAKCAKRLSATDGNRCVVLFDIMSYLPLSCVS